jgi:nicotinate-nucleotide adenylyltransferase
MTELAVFGGSFDPPHIGHVLLASYALSVSPVERVLVAPVFRHPFGKAPCAFEHRMEMCKLAFRLLPQVEVSDLERELGGTGYTVDLLEAIHKRHPHARLRLLVGADILPELDRWHHIARVRELAPLLVAGRSGFAHPDVDPDAPTLPEVSSTAIREALARAHDVRSRVPQAVLAYIEREGLYATESP